MRFADWDLRLAAYLDEVRLEPFQWGFHDCITFANNACHAQRGSGFADGDLGGYESENGALLKYYRWMQERGYSDIVDAIDDRLNRIYTKYPPRGTIVGMPQDNNNVLPFSFGVSVNQYCAFAGDQGLILFKPKDGFLYWGVE
jgi:hypothetical protein